MVVAGTAARAMPGAGKVVLAVPVALGQRPVLR